MKITHRLLLNGQVVGYRLYITKYSIRDLALDDYNLIMNYYGSKIDISNIQDKRLIEEGDLYVGEDDKRPISSMTFGEFSELIGIRCMAGTSTDLKVLYDECNKEIFNNSLPRFVNIQWSNRLTRVAGQCAVKIRRKNGLKEYEFFIKLSTHYNERFPNELKKTIVHEMIHVLYPNEGHGYNFKREMHRINKEFNLDITVYSSGRAKVCYIYKCKGCYKEYETTKYYNVEKIRCSKCHSDIFLYKDYVNGDIYYEGYESLESFY